MMLQQSLDEAVLMKLPLLVNSYFRQTTSYFAIQPKREAHQSLLLPSNRHLLIVPLVSAIPLQGVSLPADQTDRLTNRLKGD